MLLTWERALDKAETTMSQMLDNSSSTDHQLQEVMKTLEELKDVSLSPVKSSMFKSSSIHVP
eukprot:4272076-Ditylum_brightwellii.AAC.1